jgi:hypothetical protein
MGKQGGSKLGRNRCGAAGGQERDIGIRAVDARMQASSGLAGSLAKAHDMSTVNCCNAAYPTRCALLDFVTDLELINSKINIYSIPSGVD